MRKILVLRGGALGDFIVTLPALALLRERWPGTRIELAGNATAAALAKHRGLLDAVHSQHEARWSALFSAAPLPADFAAWLASFDLVLNYWPDPDAALRHHFPRHAQQTFLATAALPALAPAAAHYCEPLRTLGLEPRTLWHRLAPVALRVSAGTPPPAAASASERSNPPAAASASEWGITPVAASASEWTVPRPATTSNERISSAAPLPNACRPIALHPGSGSPRKNWPLENWRALISRLDAPLLLLLGEAERWSPMSPSGLAPHLRILQEAPLETLVAELSNCRLFLGHDSGVSHLAAACGVPSVLLFGPTDPAMWAPPAPHVRVLHRGPDLATIAVDDVLAAIR